MAASVLSLPAARMKCERCAMSFLVGDTAEARGTAVGPRPEFLRCSECRCRFWSDVPGKGGVIRCGVLFGDVPRWFDWIDQPATGVA